MSDKLEVGIDIKVHDHLTKVLTGYGKQLDGLHKKLNTFKGAFGAAAGPKTVGAGVTKAVAAAREASKIAVINAKTEKQIADIKAKAGKQAVVDAEKLKREVEKTNQLTEKGARQAQSDGLKRLAIVSNIATKEQAHVEKIVQMRQRGATAEMLGQEKVYTEMLRQLALQERIRKLQERPVKSNLTPDQIKVQNGVHRIQRAMPSGGDLIGYGQGATRRGLSGLAGFVKFGHRDEVQAYQHEKIAIQGFNLSEADNQRLYAGGNRLQNSKPGMDLATSLDVVKDLHNVFGTVEQATNKRLMDVSANALLAGKIGYHLNSTQLLNMMKNAEVMIKEDPAWKGLSASEKEEKRHEQFATNVNTQYKMMAGTGGRNNPSELRNFLTMGKTATLGLSPDSMMKLGGFILEKKGAVAGTEFQAYMDNFVHMRATDNVINAIQHYGLMSKDSHIARKKSGGIDKAHSRMEMIDMDMAIRDPIGHFNKYVVPLMEKMTDKQRDAFVSAVGGRNTTRDAISQFFAKRQMFAKEYEVTRHAANADDSMAKLQGSNALAEQRFEAAKNALMQKISPAIMEQSTMGLNMVAGGLERLGRAIDEHPGLAKLGAVAFGLFSIGSVVGGVGMQIAGVILALKAFRAAAALTAAAETLAAGELTVAGGAATTAAGLFSTMGLAITALGATALGVGYSLGALAAGIQNMLGAWDKEKRDGERAHYLQTQGAIRSGSELPFPARVNGNGLQKKEKAMPLIEAAMAPHLTLMNGGLSPQAQEIRDGALGIPTLPMPGTGGGGSGAGGVHMPVTVNVHVPAGQMTPGEARGHARRAGRILEDTVHHHLTNGSRQPTQTAPNRLR